MLLVDKRYFFSVLTAKQERTELNLTRIEENVWLINSTDYKEMLGDVHLRNSEDVLGFVFPYCVRNILESHLRLLSTQDQTL